MTFLILIDLDLGDSGDGARLVPRENPGEAHHRMGGQHDRSRLPRRPGETNNLDPAQEKITNNHFQSNISHNIALLSRYFSTLQSRANVYFRCK